MIDSEIDRSFWANWEEIEKQGAKNFTLELFELFLQNSSDLLSQLTMAVDQADFKKVSYYAHSLKSSSHQMGAVILAKELEALEIKARQGEEAIDPQVLVSIVQRLKKVQAEIRQECLARRLP